MSSVRLWGGVEEPRAGRARVSYDFKRQSLRACPSQRILDAPSEAGSSTFESGRASGTRKSKKRLKAMIRAREPMEIRYAPVPSPPNAHKSSAVLGGQATAETLPDKEKRPKNSPSFSDGERATSITRLTVHVPPRAMPTSGPAIYSIQGARAPAANIIATIQSTMTATSAFLGPARSVTNPEPTLPTMAKTVEKRRRFVISAFSIPKTARP